MKSVLSSLQLIDIDQLCLHEKSETDRLIKTSDSIQRDGFLRHPVLATKMKNSKFLVLDGVHRLSALKKLSCKRVPAQIMHPDSFTFHTWDHLVTAGTWMNQLVNETNTKQQENQQGEHFLEFVDENNCRKVIFLSDHDEERLVKWHKTVSIYENQRIKRIPHGSCTVPDKGLILVANPNYTLYDLENIVQKEFLLPAGVTRVQAHGRLLNIQVPVSLLTAQNPPIEQWDLMINEWEKSLRLYTEQIYLCE
jgi:hypothetical protein